MRSMGTGPYVSQNAARFFCSKANIGPAVVCTRAVPGRLYSLYGIPKAQPILDQSGKVMVSADTQSPGLQISV